MKRLIWCLCALFVLGLGQATAQMSQKDVEKQRKENASITKKRLNEKASKDARKQAKELRKEGWKVQAGAMPMEKQLDRSMMMLNELDSYGNPSWLTGTGQSMGENIDAAAIQALEVAKLNLLLSMEQEIAARVETSGGNQQMSRAETASALKTVVNSRGIMQQKLTGLRPVVKLYRILPGGDCEVTVTVFYSRNDMMNQARQVLREKLQEEGKELGKDLECLIFGYCPVKE